MPSRTRFLSRLIGLYALLIAAALLLHRQSSVASITALLYQPALMLIVGVFALATGLALVLTHNAWSGGAPVVVVTIIGWLTIAKGLLLLFLPSQVEANFVLHTLHYSQFFYLYMAVTLALGIFLTCVGFAPGKSLDRL